MHHHDPRLHTDAAAHPVPHTDETVDQVLALIARHVRAGTSHPTALHAEQTARPPGDGEQPEPARQAADDLLVRLIAAIERRERDPIEVTPALLAAIRRARTFDDAASAELEQLSAHAESSGDYRYRDERSADLGELVWEHLRGLLAHLDNVD
jgi:hypothetical protein